MQHPPTAGSTLHQGLKLHGSACGTKREGEKDHKGREEKKHVQFAAPDARGFARSRKQMLVLSSVQGDPCNLFLVQASSGPDRNESAED